MPSKSKWSNSAEALKDAIELEKQVTNKIIRLHKISDRTCKDVHVSMHVLAHSQLSNVGLPRTQLTNFLENDFVDEQINSLNKLKKLLTILTSAGPEGLGEYIIDRDLFEGKIKLDTL